MVRITCLGYECDSRELNPSELDSDATVRRHFERSADQKECDGTVMTTVEEGIGVVPYSPLAGGVSTDKYHPFCFATSRANEAVLFAWTLHRCRPVSVST